MIAGTGLRWDEQHQWVHIWGAEAGDAVIWRSDVVFHSALVVEHRSSEPVPPPRVSVDIRIHFP